MHLLLVALLAFTLPGVRALTDVTVWNSESRPWRATFQRSTCVDIPAPWENDVSHLEVAADDAYIRLWDGFDCYGESEMFLPGVWEYPADGRLGNRAKSLSTCEADFKARCDFRRTCLKYFGACFAFGTICARSMEVFDELGSALFLLITVANHIVKLRDIFRSWCRVCYGSRVPLISYFSKRSFDDESASAPMGAPGAREATSADGDDCCEEAGIVAEIHDALKESGWLDMDGLSELLDNLVWRAPEDMSGYELTRDAFFEAMDAIDTNKDGRVDFVEFQLAMATAPSAL